MDLLSPLDYKVTLVDLLSPLDYRVTLLLFLGGGRGASGGFEAHHRSTLSSSYMHRW